MNSTKCFFTCRTCNNKFHTKLDMEKHFMKVKGCKYYYDSEDILKGLFYKLFQTLDNNLETLKFDISSLNMVKRSRRLHQVKLNFIKIERLYNNQEHQYSEEDRDILKKFIEDYRNDILELIKLHYSLIESNITLDDI